jgi:hypothetical protein
MLVGGLFALTGVTIAAFAPNPLARQQATITQVYNPLIEVTTPSLEEALKGYIAAMPDRCETPTGLCEDLDHDYVEQSILVPDVPVTYL